MMLDPTFFDSIARFITPLLLAALGGALCDRAAVFNIALEGMMLIGAFFGVVGSYYFGSWQAGLLFAVLSGFASGVVFSWFSIYRKGDDIVVSIGFNILALGLTVFLLRYLFNTRGQFDDPNIIGLPRISIPIISDIPYIGNLFANQSILFYLAIILVFLIQFLLFRHKYGLYLRAAGDNIMALRTAGLSPELIQSGAVIACGILCALAGAQLSISSVTLFAEGMSAGRGWIAVVIIMMCAGRPLLILPATVFFGLLDAIGFRIQAFGVPQQFTDSLPYVLAIFIMAIAIGRKRRKLNK